MKKRIFSMFLVIVMIFTNVNITAFAQEQISVEAEETATEEDNVSEEEEGTEESLEIGEEGLGDETAAPVETVEVTEEPSAEASEVSSEEPVVGSTEEPSDIPSAEPTNDPAEESSVVPSQEPEVKETEVPSESPSATPIGQEIIASGKCGDNLTWTLDGDGVLTISGTGAMYDYGTPSPWREYYDTKLRRLKIENGVTYIGKRAFVECRYLRGDLVIPESVTSIGSGAFWECSGFTGDLTIPDSVISIGGDAFYGCTGFTGNITIGDNVVDIGEQAFYGCYGFTGNLILGDNLSDIGNFAFYGCSGLTGDLTIPDSVTCIGGYAFHDCSGFTGNLTIGDNVVRIGEWAFNDCTGLSGSLTIPNSVTTIEQSAFYGCSGFTGNLTIGDNVVDLGRYTFKGCSGFTGSLRIPNSVTRIEESVFRHCSGFTGDLVIPEGITTIEALAFCDCEGLTGNMIIPASVTSIGEKALDYDGYLGRINPIIYGVSGSYAETYAKENNYTFVAMEAGNTDEPGYQDYIITVMSSQIKMPIPNVLIIFDNKSYLTGADGCVKVVGKASTDYNAVIAKEGYETKEILLNLKTTENNIIYLDGKIDINVKMPEISAEIPLENEVSIDDNKFKWLDAKYKLDIKFGDKKTEEGIKRSVPLKITRDTKNKTVKVVMGIEDKDSEGNVNTDEYAIMKKLCKDILNDPSTKENKDKIFKYLKEHGDFEKNNNKGVLGVEVETHILGYFEYSYETGELIEGGALVGISGEGEMKWRPAFAGGIAYVKATLEVSAEGNLKMSFEEDEMGFTAEIELEQILGVAGGVGGDQCHLEVGLKGGLNETIEIPFQSAEESLEVALKGLFYAEGKLFAFKGKYEKEFPKLQLYPLGPDTPPVDDDGGGGAGTPFVANRLDMITFETSQMSLAERSYLSSVNMGSISYEMESNSTYPDGTPQMVCLADGTILVVWITDNGAKSSENRTTLVYSVNNGNGWSNPEAVCETGRGDFYPSLSVQGNKAHLIWTNMGQVFAEGVEAEEMLANTDIYYASFENGAFSAPMLLTQADNGLMELDAEVTSLGDCIAVAWLENSENDPFYGSGSTRIGVRVCEAGEWKDTLYVADGLVGISGMDVSCAGDDLAIAYIKDADGDIGTTDDGEVFLYRDGGVTRLTSDSKTDRNLTFSEDGDLYWLSDGEIVKMEDDGLYEVKSSGINGLQKFKLLENGTERAIAFPVTNGFRSELYLAEVKKGTLEMPVQITDCGQKIEDYALVYGGNRNVSGIVFETQVLDDAEGSPYGNTALRVYDTLKSSDVELSYIYVDEEDIMPGSEVPVTIHFYNNSSHDVNGLAVKIKKNDILVVDTTVSCMVKAGEEGEVICEYPLGSEITTHDITVEIQPAGFTDQKQGNNSVTERIALGDIAIKDAVIITTDTGAELTGKISNCGYGTTESISFKVLKGSSEGEEVFTSTYGSLAAGAETDFTYQIPESLLDYAHENDGKYFYVVCDTQTEEANYGNNSEVLVAFPTKVTGLTLGQESITLKVNEATSLTVDVQPANAMNQNIYFTTDNSEVAVVTEDGNVIATGVGTAVISAISADGGFAKSCIVDVTERDEEDITYHLSEKKMSLEKGEEALLQLMDEEDVTVSEEVSATVTWQSSNKTVATVSEDGMVTAVSAGTTQISAVIEDTFYGVCLVEVTDKELQVIIFEKEKVELIEGEKENLTVLYVPEDTVTDKQLTYVSDNDAVAVVNSNGEVTAIGEGTATITATAENGVRAQCRIEVTGLARYTVTFDALVGEEPIQVTGILYGGIVTLPENPEREGYTFLGWNAKADGTGNTFIGETTVTEDITVYAMWKKQVVNRLAAAVPDIAGGSVVNPGTQISLMCTDGAQIFYTLDETEPTATSIRYTEPIIINEDTVIKAIVVKEGYQNSEVAVFRYTVGEQGEDEEDETDSEVPPEDIPEAGIIPDGMWIAGVDEAYTYTGKAIKPAFRVYDHEKLLQAKTDYAISYKNNIKPNDASKAKTAPTITVTGKGNYKGTETVTFKILKKDIGEEDITAADITAAYNKKIQKKVPTVKRDGKKLEVDKDFTVSYPDFTENKNAYKAPGTYTILVKGKGGYTGQREVKLTITESKLMSKVTVSKIATQPYTGTAVTTATMTKAPTVKYGDNLKLQEGVHYTVTYENNVKVGTATMILTGTDTETPEGTFTGTKKVTFKIGGTGLAKAKVTGVPETMTYIGTEINEQTEKWGNPIKVELNGDELTRAADAESEGDYIVTFKNNIKKGTATVTIKGVNAYNGSIKKEFVINAYNINDNTKLNLVTEEMETETIYAKGGSKPEPVVKFGETTLVKGKDYTLTYANNTKYHDGTSTTKRPTVTITGKGNFKGTVKIPYTIAKQDIGNLKISVSDVVYKKEKGAYKATPVVKDIDNKTLKNKTDYTVTSYTYGQDITLKNGTERKAGETVGKNDIVPAGTLLKVAVTGKGNYTGNTPLVAEYRVVKSSIAKATVTVPSQPYSGKSITIEDKTKIKVKVGKNKLDPEDFEIVDGSFKNNTKVGTASFTIKGVGNYGGTKKVTFTIKKKSFIWWWRQ